MERRALKTRKSNETEIEVSVNIDGKGSSKINTGIGFFDHMLTHLSKYSFMDIDIKAKGDIDIDSHHTIEDVGILLGDTILEALGDRKGITRHGSAILPMDETLMLVAVDISGRPYLNFDTNFTCDMLGTMQTEMIEEFMRALSVRLKMNLHIKKLAGTNNHHIAEAVFKALGKALDQAKAYDSRVEGVLSTKGMLD